MNLRFTEKEEAFRAECRTWLEAHVPREALLSGDSREGFAQHVVWEKELYAAGLAVVAWPEQYGGRGSSLMEWLIFEEEYYRAGAPARVTQNGIFLLAPTLFECGTEEQKERVLRPMAAAEYLWGQAWSEPEAGSDLANLKTTATRVEGGWHLNGQKTWCTRGAFCDGAYGLARTEPDSVRHKGLTYFLWDLDSPGVTVRAVERLDGDESFAEVFLDDVFVPDANALGAVGDGWKVAMSTTSSERGMNLRSPGRFLATADRLVALWKRNPDPRLRDAVVQAWMNAQAYRLRTYQTATMLLEGESIGAESSLNKLFWSEMDVHMHETALSLLGARGELAEGSPDAALGGRWMKDYLFALAGPIYAGTNEVQRMIVARRVLGLPR